MAHPHRGEERWRRLWLPRPGQFCAGEGSGVLNKEIHFNAAGKEPAANWIRHNPLMTFKCRT